MLAKPVGEAQVGVTVAVVLLIGYGGGVLDEIAVEAVVADEEAEAALQT